MGVSGFLALGAWTVSWIYRPGIVAHRMRPVMLAVPDVFRLMTRGLCVMP
jgi:hypothetical protein